MARRERISERPWEQPITKKLSWDELQQLFQGPDRSNGLRNAVMFRLAAETELDKAEVSSKRKVLSQVLNDYHLRRTQKEPSLIPD